MKRLLLTLLLSSALTLMAEARCWMPRDVLVAPRDTTQYGEDDDEASTDTVQRTKRNIAEGMNGLDYLMAHRYMANGEEFTPKWYDHVFLQAGLGMMQMMPPNDAYRFNALTMVQGGIGKQFNKLNSARLLFHGAWGYQQAKDRRFTNYGVRLEHLFHFSSYFGGYRPSRLLEVSTILGVGFQHSQLSYKNIMWEKEQLSDIAALEKAGDFEEAAVLRENMPKDRSASSFEGHFGLQLRFFTGPQGYIHVEPYIGLASDDMDLSTNQNWRKVDVFYGLNVNYTYYLQNNLSQAERLRYSRKYQGEIIDSVKPSISTWIQPWFLQFSNGPSWMNANVGVGESMGTNTTLSIGKWLSPVIGLRLSAVMQQATWSRNGNMYNHSYYGGGRVEGLFNPLGFLKDFRWNKPFGFHLAGGIEYGQVKRYETKALSTRYEAYHAALNLWWQPADGLRLFVEPHAAFYFYKVPYSNVSWNKQHRDKSVAVQVGVSVATRSKAYQKRYFGEESEEDRWLPLTVGVAGGLHLLSPTQHDDGDATVGLSAWGFMEYAFTPLHGVRASYDYIPMKRHDAKHEESKYKIGLASLSYALNVGNLIWGHHPRRFDFSLYMGPTVCVMPSRDFGVHAGGKVSARIVPHVSAFLEPTVYLLRSKKLSQLHLLHFRNFHLLETIHVGAQYEF